MSKTVEQLEAESTAARKAFDDAMGRLDAVKSVWKLLDQLDETKRDNRMTETDKAPLRELNLAGPWLTMQATIKLLEKECRVLSDAAGDAQAAYVASWEAA
jgi:hypothetical protein